MLKKKEKYNKHILTLIKKNESQSKLFQNSAVDKMSEFLLLPKTLNFEILMAESFIHLCCQLLCEI